MSKIGKEENVFGDYKTIEVLKKGLTCTVYKGQHITNEMLYVAIKVPSEVFPEKDKTLISSQILDEIEILTRLQDGPYMVVIMNHAMQNGRPYIVLRYVSNRSLNELIKENPQGLPLELVVKYVQQAALALQHTHNKSIINCDLKPEHMLLTNKDENIVICDFGLAVQLSPGAEKQPLKPQPDGMARSKDYMAPEQKEEEGYHCCGSDQFALGLVAYEMLYGKLPDFTPQFTIIWGEQRGFSSIQIQSVLEKALAHIPSNRHQNIQVFSDALVEAVKYEEKEAAKKPTDLTSTAQINESKALLSASKQPATIPTPKQFSPNNQSSRDRGAPFFSRRTLFKYVSLTVIDAATLGILGASWVELEPKITQLFVPKIVYSSFPNQFGTIYNIYHGHQSNVNGVAWAPDNKRIASASFDGIVQIWDANNGVSLTNFAGTTNAVTPVYDVAWSPTENKVASCSNNNEEAKHTVYIWDGSTGNILSILEGHKGLINAIAWSPDGKYIASASFDYTVKVWDAHNGSLFRTYQGHKAKVYDVTWSPDSTRIASCSIKPEKAVHVWDILSIHLTQSFGGHIDDVLSVSWIPKRNGEYIASSSLDKKVHIWSAIDATDKMPQKTFEKAVRKARWSRNGKYLAAGTRSVGTIHVWIAETGHEVSLSPYNEGEQDISSADVDINALAWSYDGTTIATGGTDKLVQVWSSGLADAGK